MVWGNVSNGYAAQVILSRDALKLTADEIAWLDAHQSISVGGPRAFPPFHFFDDNGDLQGISGDYLFAIAEALGLEVIVQKNLPWPQVLKKAASGEIDLISCAAKIAELQDAMAEIKTLKGIVPICSGCKKIRDDAGFWNHLEVFIEQHSHASFSHGLCPECKDKLYGDQKWLSHGKNPPAPKKKG